MGQVGRKACFQLNIYVNCFLNPQSWSFKHSIGSIASFSGDVNVTK